MVNGNMQQEIDGRKTGRRRFLKSGILLGGTVPSFKRKKSMSENDPQRKLQTDESLLPAVRVTEPSLETDERELSFGDIESATTNVWSKGAIAEVEDEGYIRLDMDIELNGTGGFAQYTDRGAALWYQFQAPEAGEYVLRAENYVSGDAYQEIFGGLESPIGTTILLDTRLEVFDNITGELFNSERLREVQLIGPELEVLTTDVLQYIVKRTMGSVAGTVTNSAVNTFRDRSESYPINNSNTRQLRFTVPEAKDYDIRYWVFASIGGLAAKDGFRTSLSVESGLDQLVVSAGEEADDTTSQHRFEIRSAPSAQNLEYEFITDGSVEAVTHSDDIAAEPGANDTVTERDDGTYRVTGITGEGESDTWRVTGQLLRVDLNAPRSEYTLLWDGNEISSSDSSSSTHRFEIRSVPSARNLGYEFVTDGPVDAVTTPDSIAAEPEGNDTVTAESDDTYRVTGVTGEGKSDTWRVTGQLLEFASDASRSYYTLLWDGNEISPPGSDSDSNRFEIRSAASVRNLEYEFIADGSVEAITSPDDIAAEPGGNDSVTERSDGTYRVTGITGEGESDAWRVTGRLLDFRSDASRNEYRLLWNGDEISPP